MTIVRLPDEKIPALPGRYFQRYYSTKPINVYEFLEVIRALDGWVENPFGEIVRAKKPGENVTLNDIIWAYFPGHEKRAYMINQEIQNGYIIRERPTFLLIG